MPFQVVQKKSSSSGHLCRLWYHISKNVVLRESPWLRNFWGMWYHISVFWNDWWYHIWCIENQPALLDEVMGGVTFDTALYLAWIFKLADFGLLGGWGLAPRLTGKRPLKYFPREKREWGVRRVIVLFFARHAALNAKKQGGALRHPPLRSMFRTRTLKKIYKIICLFAMIKVNK